MLTLKKQPYNSVWVKADTQKELGETFIRFQEYYESPNDKIRGQYFTLGFVKNYYSTLYGCDNYSTTWTGFNFPSYVLQPFYQGWFDPLTSYEQELLNLLKYRNDKFYVIGAQTEATLRHELAHALYIYSASYQIAIKKYIDRHKEDFQIVIDKMVEKGYSEDVAIDEIQAYTTDNDDKLILENLKPIHIAEINNIYRTHKDVT